MKSTGTGGRRAGRLAGVLLALTLFGTSTAWAGEWKQEDDGWRYEENGETVTGWIRSDGIWYYMDPETGLWDEHPALDDTSACRLLENAVNRAGWYASVEEEKAYKVDKTSKGYLTVSIMLQTSPTEVTSTLNTFDINRKEGTAQSKSTKLVLDLYE